MAEEEVVHTEKKTSIFFEKYAIWVLLVFFVLAISFRYVPLIILASFLIFLFILLTYWKKYALTNVIPTVSLSQNRIFANNNTTLLLSITNDKLLPLVWLEWEMSYDDGLKLEQELNNEHRYAIRFLWLLSYQRIDWQVNVTAKRRGVYTVGEMAVLRSGDGFRFTEVEKTLQLPETLVVYPKLLPVKPLQFSYNGQLAMSGKKGSLLEDPLLIKSIREYERGDEWKKINWKASARLGTLQTTLYEHIAPKLVQIYVDVHSFATEERKPLLEDVLSIITSIAVNLAKQQVQIKYEINGDNLLGARIGSNIATNGVTLFLDHLAQVKPSSLHYEGLFQMQPQSVPTLYFCYALGKSSTSWLTLNKAKPITLFIVEEVTAPSFFRQHSVFSLLANEKGTVSI